VSELGDRVDAVAERVRARHAAERELKASAAATRAARIERRREELREAMPEVAGVVDMFRAAGVDVTVIAAREGGLSVINRKACERLGVDASGYE